MALGESVQARVMGCVGDERRGMECRIAGVGDERRGRKYRTAGVGDERRGRACRTAGVGDERRGREYRSGGDERRIIYKRKEGKGEGSLLSAEWPEA